MKYIHRTSFYMTPLQRRQIEDLGFQVPPGVLLGSDTPLVAFDAAEYHPNWLALCSLFRQWNVAPHSVRTEFTSRELDSARWLQMTAWENGYALPLQDMKFFEVTFDRTHACPRCGCGKIQNAPFRIKMEPKWGRKGIMSLNGAFDEFFVPPAVWETIFKPFGIACRPVANRHGKLLETVVQLVIEEEVEAAAGALQIRAYCDTCGRPKYRGTSRGRYPALAREPSGAIAKTRHTFHDGWDTRDVIISQDLRRAMISHKLRGAEFTPVESPLDAFEA